MCWIALLLGVLALASNFPPSQTIHIAQFPPDPILGKPILLFLDDKRSPTSCNWFRGRDQSEKSHIFTAEFDSSTGVHRLNQTGEAYTGREVLGRGCSLIIRKIQPSDSGPYTVSLMGLGESDPVIGVRNLQVLYSPFVQPPEVVRMVQFPANPRVGQSVFLYLDDIQHPAECSWFRGKDWREENRIFRAKFSTISKFSYLIDLKGPAHKGREEVWRDCSLIIRKVKASDSGPYSVSMGEEWDSHPIIAERDVQISP